MLGYLSLFVLPVILGFVSFFGVMGLLHVVRRFVRFLSERLLAI